MFLISFLFYRLDRRSVRLVKLAEDYLKIEEARLASALGALRGVATNEIMLVSNSDKERIRGVTDALRKGWFPLPLESFRQIYSFIFFTTGVTGTVIFFQPTLEGLNVELAACILAVLATIFGIFLSIIRFFANLA